MSNRLSQLFSFCQIPHLRTNSDSLKSFLQRTCDVIGWNKQTHSSNILLLLFDAIFCIRLSKVAVKPDPKYKTTMGFVNTIFCDLKISVLFKALKINGLPNSNCVETGQPAGLHCTQSRVEGGDLAQIEVRGLMFPYPQ